MDGDGIRIGGVTVPAAELEWRFSASGGPGGQHANTANTRAEVRLDLAGSPSLPDDLKARLVRALGPEVRVVAAGERSQLRNREVALERLERRLAGALRSRRPRRATRPTAASKAERLRTKARRSAVKRDRRPPSDES
jgi:ribosome-associated protein